MAQVFDHLPQKRARVDLISRLPGNGTGLRQSRSHRGEQPASRARWPPGLRRRRHGGHQQRADCVEQPAHARGGHAVNVPFELAPQHLPVRSAEAARTGGDRAPTRCLRPTGGPGRPGRACGRWCRRPAGDVAQVGRPFEAVVAGHEDLAAPYRTVGPVAGAVEGEADDRSPSGTPCSAITAAMWAWWCWTSSTGRPAARPRPSGGSGSRGGRRPPPAPGSPGTSRELPDRALEGGEGRDTAHVADVLAHPGVPARRPGRRCSSARRRRPPTGRAPNGKRTGSGAYPRERRIGSSSPPRTRTTESSQGTWMGRLWTSQASTRRPSRARASSSS